MSKSKRALMFNDVNPIHLKYLNSGDVPAQYVPPEKRKKVSDYMKKSHIRAGTYGGPNRLQTQK